jgi:hypothetical protein
MDRCRVEAAFSPDRELSLFVCLTFLVPNAYIKEIKIPR